MISTRVPISPCTDSFASPASSSPGNPGRPFASGTPLSGRSFTVCQGTGTAAYTVKHQDGTTETLTNLTSQSSGVFWIGELPYGTYTIREGNGAVFTLTVGDDTVPGSRDGVVITPVS